MEYYFYDPSTIPGFAKEHLVTSRTHTHVAELIPDTIIPSYVQERSNSSEGVGQYALRTIHKHTILFPFNSARGRNMNDLLFPTNLAERVRDCGELDDFYHFMKTVLPPIYYNPQRLDDLNNTVCFVDNNTNAIYVFTRVTVEKDVQLSRCYGLGFWLFELWSFITRKNVEGLRHFISDLYLHSQTHRKEILKHGVNRELVAKLHRLHNVLDQFNLSCDNDDDFRRELRASYDATF